MSDAYRRYYAIMQDAIDPETRSLVTQFAIGWAVTYFAFSSQRVMRAEDWERLTWEQLKLIPGPDRRLEAAIATIRRKPGFITDLVGDAQSELVAHGFDWASLDDDDVWCIKAAEDGHERAAVDNFLIRFALTRIARETGMDIVQPEFRDLPALRQPLRLLEVRQHPRAKLMPISLDLQAWMKSSTWLLQATGSSALDGACPSVASISSAAIVSSS